MNQPKLKSNFLKSLPTRDKGTCVWGLGKKLAMGCRALRTQNHHPLAIMLMILTGSGAS